MPDTRPSTEDEDEGSQGHQDQVSVGESLVAVAPFGPLLVMRVLSAAEHFS